MCSDGSDDALRISSRALDRLAAEDLKSMFGPQVLERTRLLRAQNRLDAQVARTVREGELTQAAEHDGQKTMQSWLRGHAGCRRAGRRSWSAPAGRWSTCRPWRRRSPTAG